MDLSSFLSCFSCFYLFVLCTRTFSGLFLPLDVLVQLLFLYFKSYCFPDSIFFNIAHCSYFVTNYHVLCLPWGWGWFFFFNVSSALYIVFPLRKFSCLFWLQSFMLVGDFSESLDLTRCYRFGWKLRVWGQELLPRWLHYGDKGKSQNSLGQSQIVVSTCLFSGVLKVFQWIFRHSVWMVYICLPPFKNQFRSSWVLSFGSFLCWAW